MIKGIGALPRQAQSEASLVRATMRKSGWWSNEALLAARLSLLILSVKSLIIIMSFCMPNTIVYEGEK